MSPRGRSKSRPSNRAKKPSVDPLQARVNRESARIERRLSERQKKPAVSPSVAAPNSSRPSKTPFAEKYKVVKKAAGLSFKNPNRLGKKNKRKISKIYRDYKTLENKGYIFSPVKSEKNRKIVKKIFPERYSKAFKGVFVPKTAIGKKGKLKFAKKSFKIISEEMPEQIFYPIDPILAVQSSSEGQANDYIHDLIADAPDDAIFAPISENIGTLEKYGKAGDKGQIEALINDWINAYGWTQGPPSKKPNNDMSNWFVGIKIIRRGFE